MRRFGVDFEGLAPEIRRFGVDLAVVASRAHPATKSDAALSTVVEHSSDCESAADTTSCTTPRVVRADRPADWR
jgi:hypothetical protein